jgi:hypothetical protein
MQHEVPESDWKAFRELRQVALERFCKRVLDEVPRFALDMQRSYHERYLELFRWLGERNEEFPHTPANTGTDPVPRQGGTIASA